MSDIFQVVLQQSTPHSSHPSRSHPTHAYIKLQGDFLAQNFGHYTLRFIQMICSDAYQNSPMFETLSLNKILRDITRKYMFSDLQLVYVGHISSLLGWNINHNLIRKHCQKLKYLNEHTKKETQQLFFFVSLVGFFVKKYLGQIQECRAISDLLAKETENNWKGLYDQWLGNCPSEIFRLSPRAINELYSRYSRHCQQALSSKNYNTMVDQIMQLSTTYSMIPGQVKEQKKKRSGNREEPIDNSSHIFGRKIVKINELPPGSASKYLQLKNQAPAQSNYQSEEPLGSGQKEKKYKLGFNKNKETKINHNVTQFFKDKQQSSMSVGKKYNPRSIIGFVDPNPNFFDSKLFSSGEDIIPYPLRSNSNLFKSKWLE